MAVGSIAFNDQTQHGRLLRRFLNGLESSLDDGADVLACLQQMLDGDGSNISHFDYIVTKFAFGGWSAAVNGGAVTDAQRTDAKACWDELNSAYSKLSGDGSVSFVNAAIRQVIAKLR